MKKLFIIFLVAVFSAQLVLPLAWAGPDRYIGDSAIYSGESVFMRPNVLFIFDNNSTMGNAAATGDPYNPATTYAGTYASWTVYKVVGPNYVSHIANATSALANVTCAAARTALMGVQGSYSAAAAEGLKNDGTCGNGGSGLTYLGNILNYNAAAGSGSSDAQVRVIRSAVATISSTFRNTVNMGLMTFGENKSGGRIVTAVTNMSESTVTGGSAATATAYTNFLAALPGTGSTGSGGTYADGASPSVALIPGNGRPLAESLYDAGAYFKGVYPVIYNQGSFASPIAYTCQKNYVIVLTNGDTDLDNNPKLYQATALGTVGDYDADGAEGSPPPITAYGTGTHFMDDVAKFIYENDMSSSLSGTQRVVTHAVQVFVPEKTLVKRATNSSHGRGTYHVAADANALSAALSNIMNSIVLEADTSFVAPVVPVSPENRTYSGSRVYLGFFKPISEKPWLGNLKKYGIDGSNNIVDKNGAIATESDGSFKSTAVSYWSSSADGGHVDQGGAGQVLYNRASARNIYTYTGSSTSLTNSTNAFTTANAAITAATLDNPDSRDNLIDFVRGVDKYDDDGDGNTTEKRDWPMGDILHSKPLVVNYASYTFSAANEANCSVNKTMVYVGGNDGMLHAFNDCDGSEAWAFIPQDLLANLKYLREESHSYFVDSSPSVYIYDADTDGNIESGDKVILMLGERRGGGKDASPTGGFYYALDVTDPAAPVYMWRLSNTVSPSGTNTDYSELAETWSEPKIGKVKISTTDKIVAFIGAGYDNLNEDSRYGHTQTYSGTGTVSNSDKGSGTVTSAGASAASNPKGRGLYVVEIASLSSGVPSFTNSGYKVWGHTYGGSDTSTTSTGMTFSIASEVTALDTNYDGYHDRVYVGDTGGNLWKFNVSATATSSWTATRLFSINPSSGADTGRKIFYKPSVTYETGYSMFFIGSGDREHPLNRDVVDRMYGLKDSAQSTTKLESDMLDVTTDILQTGDASEIAAALASLNSGYGWFIQLNLHSGEKVLAPGLAFNKVAYYTTYAPNTSAVADPCSPGNLGTSRLYAVDYKTGEAVINYDTGNDSTSTTNARATAVAGQVLLRSDREQTLGSGIPSGIVMVIGTNGEPTILVGCGGAICSSEPKSGGTIIPIYWRNR